MLRITGNLKYSTDETSMTQKASNWLLEQREPGDDGIRAGENAIRITRRVIGRSSIFMIGKL